MRRMVNELDKVKKMVWLKLTLEKRVSLRDGSNSSVLEFRILKTNFRSRITGFTSSERPCDAKCPSSHRA